MASAFEGMLALEPLKPGETYGLPTMVVMALTFALTRNTLQP